MVEFFITGMQVKKVSTTFQSGLLRLPIVVLLSLLVTACSSDAKDDQSASYSINIARTGQVNGLTPGDDADWQAGEAWPDPRFTDNADGTVTDNLTRLIWLQSADCLAHKTWANAVNEANTLAQGACGLIDGSRAGDWRLANVGELQTLIDHNYRHPLLPEDHPFSYSQSTSYQYWSSTTSHSNTELAWRVDLNNGFLYEDDKFSDNFHALPVRGGQSDGRVPQTGQVVSFISGDDGDWQAGVPWPDERFTDNADGAVTDKLTGLVWLKNSSCFKYEWWDGIYRVNLFADDGTEDCGLGDSSLIGLWRVPNIRELQSLIDYGRSYPSLPLGHPFLDVQSTFYWTSTTSSRGSSRSLGIYLDHGMVFDGYKSGDYMVWPVRNGNAN